MIGLVLCTLPLVVSSFPQGLLVPAQPLMPIQIPAHGAPIQIDELNKEQLEIVDLAFLELSYKILDNCATTLIRVEDFTRQIVAGNLYKFNLVVEQDPACSKHRVSKCNMAVLDKPWENSKKVIMENINCHEMPEEPVVVGAGVPIKVDELNRQQKEIVDFAFLELSYKILDNCINTLVRVEDFTKQIVEGNIYRFNLVVKQDPMCSQQEMRKCSMVVYDKPWENYRELESVFCNEMPTESSLLGVGHGAPIEVDELNEKQKEIVDFAFHELYKILDNCATTLIAVEDFSMQVVNGYLYKFSLVVEQDPVCSDGFIKGRCSMEVIDQPWENHREVLLDSFYCYNMHEEPSRPAYGEPAEVDELTEDQQKIVDFALHELSKQTPPDECAKNLLRVENFSEQIVSGTFFKFDLIMEYDSSCSNGQIETKCHMAVLEKSWMNYRQVIWDRVVCEDVSRELLLVGNGAPIQVDELNVNQQKIVEFAFNQLSSRTLTPAGCAKNLKRVENFSHQIVAGDLYKFDVVMEYDSSCSDDHKERKCTLVVYDKPWENFREVQWEKIRCDKEVRM